MPIKGSCSLMEQSATAVSPARVGVNEFLRKERFGEFLKTSEADSLLKRSGTGDKAARDELISRFIPLAFLLARKDVKGRWVLYDDMVSAAILAVVETVANWDQAMNPAFLVYQITIMARRAMRAVVLSGTKPLSVPRTVAMIPFDRWTESNNNKNMPRAAIPYMSLSTDSPDKLLDITVEPRATVEADARMDVQTLLKPLPAHLRDVIERVYGIGGRPPETVAEITPGRRVAAHYRERAMKQMRKMDQPQTV